MRLEFVPVEEFYFALTLAVKTLEEVGNSDLVEQVRSRLEDKFGQSSTVAAAKQNNFNYVFRVQDYDNSPSPQLVLSIADWNGKVRLSSDYGWTLDADRKPKKTDRYEQRQQFINDVHHHLKTLFDLDLPALN
ncbi:hypothetical protein [Leptolyngbya ohadii]|uniref:hypothetical protein n=1 Tax=Leptolyngbya ohadii TaxID=1962290 RepID=UPI000B59C9E8|nr:hypothetical protein [Leptolyngbya ohadii]